MTRELAALLLLQSAPHAEGVGASTSAFVALSFAMFVIGVVGVLVRRNALVVFMSIELILNAVNLNLVAFSRHWEMHGAIAPTTGQVFALFVIVVAAAEVAIGLGIVIVLYRLRGTTALDDVNLLKW